MIKQEIINKYSVSAPRYTSYPPANFFHENFTDKLYLEAVKQSNTQYPQHISIYIHFPFCYQMCYYCGCNAMLMENRQIVTDYIEALKKEIQMILPLLASERKVSQIHYGGGSPSSLPIATLKELNDIILSQFDTIEDPEIAIECHPGYLNEEYWRGLSEAGFNRVSLGVQDFDEDVLKTANRKKSRMPIEEIVQILKEQNISVNMDFIYGLPMQTTESFSKTIQRAIDIKPDRIVTFSYGHVPWFNPLQKKLEEAGLPQIQNKSQMFDKAKTLLTDAGYKSIGLDHFVLPDDELYNAVKEKSLHRNFQGYCTRRTTGQVYAFGVTAISQLSSAYCQNTKDLSTYIKSINEGKISIAKGYALNEEEQIARSVINALMCNYFISWSDIAQETNKTIPQVKASINYCEEKLAEFAKDGIIQYDDDYIEIMSDATPFVRNVAASLDKLLIDSDKIFSRV